MRVKLIILSINLLFMCPWIVGQEVLCPPADKSTFIQNPSTKINENLFVFYGNDQTNILTQVDCSLLIDQDSSIFRWYKFEPSDFTFTELAVADTGITSTRFDLSVGDYRIDIVGLKEPLDTQLIFHIHNPIFTSKIFKDFDGRAIQATFCDALKLVSNAVYDTLFYYDLNDTTMHERISKLDSMYWSISFLDEADSEFNDLKGTTKIDAYTISPPPMEDVNIKLTLVDEYGQTTKDSADFIAIAVRAKFEVNEHFITDPVLYDNIEDQQFYEQYYSSETSSAPHKVKFTNESTSKVEEYEWRFGDGNRAEFPDSTTYTYQFPGEYTPVLKVTNGNCEDEIEGNLIDVNTEGPVLEFPNMMVIGANNTSGKPFIFRSHDISVRDFKIVIFNRWGVKVHDFKGESIRDWRGWDGTNKGTGRLVETGVYYYAVKYADAFDDKEKEVKFRNSQKNGFIHVYNTIK